MLKRKISSGAISNRYIVRKQQHYIGDKDYIMITVKQLLKDKTGGVLTISQQDTIYTTRWK
ncbi:MAG: hypothetical protein AABY49_09085 [Planctomycetota bacterium]